MNTLINHVVLDTWIPESDPQKAGVRENKGKKENVSQTWKEIKLK